MQNEFMWNEMYPMWNACHITYLTWVRFLFPVFQLFWYLICTWVRFLFPVFQLFWYLIWPSMCKFHLIWNYLLHLYELYEPPINLSYDNGMYFVRCRQTMSHTNQCTTQKSCMWLKSTITTLQWWMQNTKF